MEASNFVKITHQWLRTVVVGLNLCPFAAEPLQQGRVRFAVCEDSEPEEIYRALLGEMEIMLSLAETEVETTLLIVPHGLISFESYLELLYSAEEAILEVGLEGTFQLASFHPDYCFAGVDRDDPANYSNRSPFPMFHLIREASLEKVLSGYPHPALIPQRNIDKLRSLGLAEMQLRFRLCRQ